MTMTTELAPLAHPERKRLTACLGCGLSLTDDTAHPTAIQCRAALLAALAAVTAERDDARARFTQARSTLALVRSQVGTLGQTLAPREEQP